MLRFLSVGDWRLTVHVLVRRKPASPTTAPQSTRRLPDGCRGSFHTHLFQLKPHCLYNRPRGAHGYLRLPSVGLLALPWVGLLNRFPFCTTHAHNLVAVPSSTVHGSSWSRAMAHLDISIEGHRCQPSKL